MSLGFDLTIRVEVSAPTLEAIGERLVEAIDRVEQSLRSVRDKLATELPQIAEAIRNTTDPTRLHAIADDLDTLGGEIENIIPEMPPPPDEPPPEA